MCASLSNLLDPPADAGILDRSEFYRLDAGRLLSGHRGDRGQFFTPPTIARFMAGLSESPPVDDLHLLDPGAGVGNLTAAWIERILSREHPPKSLRVTACEIDTNLIEYLHFTLDDCRRACDRRGIECEFEIIEGDFVATAADWLADQPLFGQREKEFHCAILNPPYRKIKSESDTRRILSNVGIETSNLYSAFLWLVLKLVAPGGELIAITPRSFCNGPYFRPFRAELLSKAHFSRIHVFDSRESAFQRDDVLQENVVFRAVKGPQTGAIEISVSRGPDDPDVVVRSVGHDELVHPSDPSQVIHLVPDELQFQVARQIRGFTSSLQEIGIQVSTGRVVDFRAKEFLIHDGDAAEIDVNAAPLLYPTHLRNGVIAWPKPGKKPNYLRLGAATLSLLVPAGPYVLVKRFSAKEESRRVVAAVCTHEAVPGHAFAFENHLNYFHADGEPLPVKLARGLCFYLNSSLVDAYFRQFSGHTQVNSTDLRALPYPERAVLERIGAATAEPSPSQDEIDRIISQELSLVAKKSVDPVKARKRIGEALAILKQLGLPRAQQNDRSALTLLALTDVKPQTPWSKSASPLMGITPIMDFSKRHYGIAYAPNTRETFRRQTMHQFVEAGIAIYNPDKPDRPVNSPHAVYQIAPLLLDALRSFKTKRWPELLQDWLATVESLKERYRKPREMAKIPLRLPTGEKIELSPGGQNVVVEQVIHEFCPRFAPGAVPIYVGDTEEKYAYFNHAALTALGVKVDAHGKMPDVIIHLATKNWLFLIEAVSSHGPVDSKRHAELSRLFAASTAPLVFVTAFMDRSTMARYLGDISWETEVWVAEAPSHMIHFNGERFLGPH